MRIPQGSQFYVKKLNQFDKQTKKKCGSTNCLGIACLFKTDIQIKRTFLGQLSGRSDCFFFLRSEYPPSGGGL